jgi:biopolymer transport protein ExbB
MSKKLLFIFLAAVFFHAPAFAEPTFAEEVTAIEVISEGGVAILVIVALSVLFLAVSIERLVHFRKKFIIPENLINQVKPFWASGDFQKLQSLLDNENSTLARTIQFMVANRQQNYGIVSSGVGDIASLELRHHQQKAYALAIVATVAPIVGLLGTVIGMIDAFHVIAYSEGMGNPALLAGGISKALINTAGGLSVALPALGMHHFFKNRSAFFGMLLEKKINGLLNEWFMPANIQAQPTHLAVVHHAH